MSYVILAQAELPKNLTRVEVLVIFDTQERLDEFYKGVNQNQCFLYVEFPPDVDFERYKIKESDGKTYYNLAKISETYHEPVWPKSYIFTQNGRFHP